MTHVNEHLQATEVEMWQAHSSALVRYATLLAGPVDAGDIVSVAFAKVVARHGTEDLVNVRAYLMRAVTNTAFDQQRSSKRRQSRDLNAVLQLTTSTPDSNIDLRRAVAGLSVQQRAVVYFTFWEDLDAAHIGRLLGIAPATVRRHLARARANLRKVLV